MPAGYLKLKWKTGLRLENEGGKFNMAELARIAFECGWKSTDAETLISEYRISKEQASEICREISKFEEGK